MEGALNNDNEECQYGKRQPWAASRTTVYTTKSTTLPDCLFPNTNTNSMPSPSPSSLVVTIDINGNRTLEMVQRCIHIVMQQWQPRLILVKSTALFDELGR